MSEENHQMKKEKGATQSIRNALGSDTNRRFLTRMNAFRLETDIPDRLTSLLLELERTEAKG